MALYVLSDLHLDEAGGARLFRDARQGERLAALLGPVAEDPEGELVLLGDIFDLTSMEPPQKGWDAYCRALELPLTPRPQRALRTLCEVVEASNPHAVAALAEVSRRIPVTLVPGNHDRHLAGPGAAEALGAVGLGGLHVASAARRELGGRTVALLHGHAFDPDNARPNGRGEVITRVLHQAVIPALERLAPKPHVRVDPGRIVSLRPEEQLVPVLQRWLPERTFLRLFHALLELLAHNGVVPERAAFLTHLVTPERVHKLIARQRPLWWRAGRRAQEVLLGERSLPEGLPTPDVLVLGHTHVLDWAVVGDGKAAPEKLYVNLGTWTERTHDAMSPPDASLPLLVLDVQGREVVAELFDLAGPKAPIQRYAVPRLA